MAKNKLSEGQVLNNFILNEMDFYVPQEDDFEDEVAVDDYMGNMESEFDYGYDVGSVDGDDFDDYEDEINYEDELDSDDSFLIDMESDIDFMDDAEEEFYDNELTDEIPVFESKKRK